MLTPHLTPIRNKALSGALFFFLSILLGLSPKGFAAEQRSFISSEARLSWENVLYYSNRIGGRRNSLVDSPDFFLSKTGKADSASELSAFIEAIAKDTMQMPEDKRMSCVYPARKLWLLEFRPEIKLPAIDCPTYAIWLQISQPAGLSLIFSSYFVNNPSSMMGHTFLRIRRGAATNSPLLDQSVNFAANPTHEIPILYNIDGLAGGFPGTFAMMPYYIKVQEYANVESRDLWEYDLNLDPKETLRVMASLWELLPEHIDYYFFDENCSAVLLYLIQNGRPGLSISDQLGYFVHPSDTLRYLMDAGMVKETVYRPSSRSRFQTQWEALSTEERAVFDEIREAKSLRSGSLIQRDDASQSRIVDAMMAFIEYDESLYGKKTSVKHAELYNDLLTTRSKLKSAPIVNFPMPKDEAPHLGHRGRRLGLGLGTYQERGELQLEYRPGQHDLLSPAIGYPPELSIQLGKTRLDFADKQTARIRSAEFFHIQSFNPSRSGRFPGSWQLQTNFENTENKKFQIFGSIGQAMNLGSRETFGFLFYDTRLKVERGEAYACPGFSTGARFSYEKRLVSFTDVGAERCYGKETGIWRERWSQEIRYGFDAELEFFLEARKYVDAKEFTLGIYKYY